MKKSGTDDNRNERCICIALTVALALLGSTGTVVATERGHWPHATYYTVVARAGDTVTTIAARYRLTPALVIKLNGLETTGRVPAGRVVLIPANTPATRAAVLSDAMDRSAPNFATRPRSAVIADSSTSAAGGEKPMALPSPAMTQIQAVDRAQTRSQGFAWPITGPVISNFGPGPRGTRNEGINIGAERGMPFRAAAGGTVSYAGALRGYGNLILITHGHSYITAYAHADHISVARGEFVAKGQVIGTAGTTGGVDRPQLHFEIRRGLTAIDPNLLLAANS